MKWRINHVSATGKEEIEMETCLACWRATEGATQHCGGCPCCKVCDAHGAAGCPICND